VGSCSRNCPLALSCSWIDRFDQAGATDRDVNKTGRRTGMSDENVKHGPVLNHASMVIDAAINGQGIALARTTLAAWDLINGRLVRPFPDSLPVSKTYWIVCPKATASLPKIATSRE
jgi:LysR family glycine cleavage system transcriptional activator